MKKSEKSVWIIAGALLAGTAGEWFLSGSNSTHSLLRNALVVIQLLLGLGMLLCPFLFKTKRKNGQ